MGRPSPQELHHGQKSKYDWKSTKDCKSVHPAKPILKRLFSSWFAGCFTVSNKSDKNNLLCEQSWSSAAVEPGFNVMLSMIVFFVRPSVQIPFYYIRVSDILTGRKPINALSCQ